MTQENKPNAEFDSSNFFVFLLRWRKPLIIVSIIAAVFSAVVSLMIDEKYLSTTIFFPANNKSLSKAVLTEDAQGKNDISSFGEEEEAEAMLQILQSDKIKWHIWGKYQMMEHYGIDPEEEEALTKLGETWEDNTSFKRTEFNSIRIDVLDKDKELAAKLANDIAAWTDSTKNEMLRDRAQDALKVIEKEYLELEGYMQHLDDSLTVLRQKGVHEYDSQIEMITGVYYKAIADNNTRARVELEAKLDTLAKYGSAYKSMTENLEFLRERLILLRGKYDEAKVDATQNGTWKFVVNKAVPAEKKAYPIRWLIVVVSTVAAFLMTILVVIAVENYEKYADQV